jgi:hypothetical protein
MYTFYTHHRKRQCIDPPLQPTLADDRIRMMQPLWQVLVQAAQDDAPLSCDECYVLMDYLADLLAEGIHSSQVLSLADRYVASCRDCDVRTVFDANTVTRSAKAGVEDAGDLTPA